MNGPLHHKNKGRRSSRLVAGADHCRVLRAALGRLSHSHVEPARLAASHVGTGRELDRDPT